LRGERRKIEASWKQRGSSVEERRKGEKCARQNSQVPGRHGEWIPRLGGLWKEEETIFILIHVACGDDEQRDDDDEHE
jgi:hypothetical protein